MSFAKRVRRHPWTSSALLVASVVFAVAGCAGGSAKRAAAGVAPATAQYGEPSHATIEPRAPAPERPGLGTSWGETVSSPLTIIPFERASAAPWAELALHYNDAEGVAAHARYLDARP